MEEQCKCYSFIVRLDSSRNLHYLFTVMPQASGGGFSLLTLPALARAKYRAETQWPSISMQSGFGCSQAELRLMRSQKQMTSADDSVQARALFASRHFNIGHFSALLVNFFYSSGVS